MIRIGVAILIIFFAVACSSEELTSGTTSSPTPIQTTPTTDAQILAVVATSNIIADWLQHVGGSRIKVHSLVPLGGDPHSFQPTARDLTRVAEADLVVSMGLGLEETWLRKLVHNAAREESRIVELGDFIDPIGVNTAQEGKEVGQQYERDNQQELMDPHFWFDPHKVKKAVSELALQLSELDQQAENLYHDNATTYNASLDDLHSWILDQTAAIPENRRLLITVHDSLQYFALRYGFTVTGVLRPSGGTDQEPSAKRLTELSMTILAHDVPAIFTEIAVSDRLAHTIAEETGTLLVSDLYVGSLGRAGTGTETYLKMMQHNINLIVNALR